MDAYESSELLVERAKRGDRAAFGELSKRYEERVRAVLLNRLGEQLRRRLSVEDIIQETFLRSYRAIDRFEWREEDAFLRWVTRIAANVLQESARREKLDLLIPLVDGEEIDARETSPSQACRRGERFDRLQEALNSLKPEHREVILLARIERLPMREVARRLDRSPGAVAQLLRRALKNLKDNFGSTESYHLPDRSLLDSRRQW